MDPVVQRSKVIEEYQILLVGSSVNTRSTCQSVKCHDIQPRPLSSGCNTYSKDLSGSETLTHHCQLNQAQKHGRKRAQTAHHLGSSAQSPPSKPLPWQVLFFSS